MLYPSRVSKEGNKYAAVTLFNSKINLNGTEKHRKKKQPTTSELEMSDKKNILRHIVTTSTNYIWSFDIHWLINHGAIAHICIYETLKQKSNIKKTFFDR